MTDLSACPIPTILESAAAAVVRPWPVLSQLRWKAIKQGLHLPPRSATELFIIGVRVRGWRRQYRFVQFRECMPSYSMYVALDFRELHRYETVPRAAITVTRLFGLRFGRMTIREVTQGTTF